MASRAGGAKHPYFKGLHALASQNGFPLCDKLFHLVIPYKHTGNTFRLSVKVHIRAPRIAQNFLEAVGLLLPAADRFCWIPPVNHRFGGWLCPLRRIRPEIRQRIEPFAVVAGGKQIGFDGAAVGYGGGLL